MPHPHSPARSAMPALARGLALLVAAVVVGCGPAVPSPRASETAGASPSPSVSPTPSPSVTPAGSQDTAAIYRSIESQVVEIRGLQPKADVDPKVLGTAELKVRIETSFHEDNPPELVAANERLLKGLGLLASNANLTDLYIELLGSQVAGFYSPDDKQLYVVSKSGGLGPTERVTFAHEYTHALQDQTFDLAGLDLDEVGHGDRGLARLGLVEGDATATMTFWLFRHLTAPEILQIQQEAQDPEAMAVLEKMPPILRDTLTFPYDTGLRFVLALQGEGGFEAVNAAFRAPPASTEQVIHPDKYRSGEQPISVDLPDDLAARMGTGWKSSLEDTLGEFQLGKWLEERASAATATEAAAGWGGDRVVVLDGPAGSWAIGLVSDWDSATDAGQFADAAGQAVAGLSTPGTVSSQAGSSRVVVVVGSDEAAATKLDALIGTTGV